MKFTVAAATSSINIFAATFAALSSLLEESEIEPELAEIESKLAEIASDDFPNEYETEQPVNKPNDTKTIKQVVNNSKRILTSVRFKSVINKTSFI